MSAYYAQHNPGASPSRIRQEGFTIPSNSPSLNAPPSPTTPFDSQNVFFAGSHNVFPNAFKKFNDRNAIDFSDTLASIMSPDSADDPHRAGASATFRHSLDYPSASSATTSGHSHSQSASSHFFDIPSFPSHLNNFRAGTATDAASSLTGVADANPPGLTQPQPTPGSLGHNFLADPQLAFHHAHPPGPQRRHRASFSAAGPPPVLPRLNTMRTASPSTNHTGSPSDMNAVVPSSPFSPGAMGVQPSSGAVRSTSRSRSRSRPASGATTGPGGVIERNPSVSARSRVAKKRTTSISSPSPPGGTPGSIVNGAVVPSVQQQSSQQPQQQQPLAMSIIIPDPRNAQAHQNVATASPATTAASWVFSPSSTQTAFSLPNGESTAATSFNNTFAPGGQSLPMGGVFMDDDKTPPTKEDASSKQVALLNEKRRRRRESHNAVERRRRDNINEKINELATLIPECLLLEGNNNAGLSPGATAGHEDGAGERPPHGLDGDLAIANGSGSGQGAGAAGSGDDDQAQAGAHAAMKANKGVILRKSVDYIRYLQQLVQAQSEKNHDLELQLAQYRNGQPNGQGHQSMPSQSGAEEFSSSPGPSNPSGSGHGNMIFLPSNDGSSGVDAFGNPTDFAPFDFSRFTQPNGELNHNHLVSVKEEDPSGMMDMNVLPDEHQLPPPQPHHQLMHNGYEHHPQPQFDLASLPPYHPQNGFIPSSSHQQQLASQVHQHQQQRMHQPVMEQSPSAAGSGSNVSDLEDVEEEDESPEGGIVDNNSNNSQPRGRKELRDAQPGRFSHSSSASLGGGRNASSRSASKDHRARMGFGPGPGTPGGDAMHVDERP